MTAKKNRQQEGSGRRRGTRGKTGARGEKGEKGDRGETGPAGPPGAASPAVLMSMRTELDRMRADAEFQFQRITQLQAQLDLALAELEGLKKPSN